MLKGLQIRVKKGECMTVKERAKVILEEIKDFYRLPKKSEEYVIQGIMLGLLKLELEKGEKHHDRKND